MAKLPSLEKCGCALYSVGAPWVAHLVWPIPVVPLKSIFFDFSTSSDSLPFALQLFKPVSPAMQMPAESYPLYSNFSNPESRKGFA